MLRIVEETVQFMNISTTLMPPIPQIDCMEIFSLEYEVN